MHRYQRAVDIQQISTDMSDIRWISSDLRQISPGICVWGSVVLFRASAVALGASYIARYLCLGERCPVQSLSRRFGGFVYPQIPADRRYPTDLYRYIRYPTDRPGHPPETCRCLCLGEGCPVWSLSRRAGGDGGVEPCST